MGKFYESSKDASKGGFASIKKVRGLCIDLDVVPPPDGWETDKMQVKASLEDAKILEMFNNEEDFELTDNKFSTMWSYGLDVEKYEENPERKPPAGCPWMAAGVKSAEKLGKKPSDFIGQVITLERLPVVLFSHRPKKDEEGNDIPKGEDGKYPLVDVTAENYFSFVEDEDAQNENTVDYLKGKLIGKTEKAVKRLLLTDVKLKQFPEYRNKLTAGTLAEFAGLVVVDGKFQEA